MTDHDPLPDADVTSARTQETASGAGPGGFGPYRFIQLLGEGGMGEVWLAEQLRPLRRQVAVKIVKAGMDTAQVVARFEAERQALAVMDHPAIAKVFDAGTTPEGRPYFAMEYVRGEPITRYCDRHRLPISERLELFIQLCEGVQHAHQKGIIHRDLKPSNVLVSVADDKPVPRIIDFGIAKAVSQPLTERALVTEVGGFLGTPEYMSPEQADGGALDVDTRSDVYSLGVLLYELLVGTLPFDSAALRQSGVDGIRRTIRDTDAVRPSTRLTRNPELSAEAAEHRQTQPARLAGLLRGDLDWIVLQALDKERARRYQTANALGLDIRRHLDHEPVLAGAPSRVYKARKFARRHRIGVAASAALVIMLIAFAGVMTVQAGRIARERDRANNEAMTARQVSDFLVGLFRVSDPSEARGNVLTAREILENGAGQLEGALRDQPAVQARLQATIGQVYTGLGMYKDARPMLERAYETQKSVTGERSAEALETANRLADTYWYLGDYRAAEPLYKHVVDGRTRLLGSEHQQTLKASFDLASLYARQKRWDEFERLAKDVLARQRRVLGDDHADTLASLNNLGSVYDLLGRDAEALTISIEVAEKKRRLLGDDHPSTLMSLHNLASAYEDVGRHDDAQTSYAAAIAGRRRVLGPAHPNTINSVIDLARSYSRQRRSGESERTLLDAYSAAAAATSLDQPNVQRVVRELVTLYELSGQPRKAAEWRAKLR